MSLPCDGVTLHLHFCKKPQSSVASAGTKAGILKTVGLSFVLVLVCLLAFTASLCIPTRRTDMQKKELQSSMWCWSNVVKLVKS